MKITKSITLDPTFRKLIKEIGLIYYVSTSLGDDDNPGTSPNAPLATLGQALTNASSGDIIRLGPGSYTETGLDISKDYLKILLDKGALLAPTSGSPLVITGNYNYIGPTIDYCAEAHNCIFPPDSNTGVNISGANNYLNAIGVDSNQSVTSSERGFDISGLGNILQNCQVKNPLNYGFRTNKDTLFMNCNAIGETGSIGFFVRNGANGTRFFNCSSNGNQLNSFYVFSTAVNVMLVDCVSGKGDGPKYDPDGLATIINFKYADTLNTDVTFTATGGVGASGTNYNLFQVTGTVQISELYGIVTTVLPNTSSIPNIELYSSNASVDITDVTSGPDIDSAAVGAILIRNEPVAEPLNFGNPDGTPAVRESVNYNSPKTPVVIQKDDAADTFIQLQLSAALASGAMRWYVKWEPLSDDGFLAVV